MSFEIDDDPRCVDERDAMQGARRVLDDETLDHVGCSTTEIDRDGVVGPLERQQLGGSTAPGLEHGPVGEAVARYHVTVFVHSPASVAASSAPTRAFNSVDLPAFTFPAIATRSGSSRRRAIVWSRRLSSSSTCCSVRASSVRTWAVSSGSTAIYEVRTAAAGCGARTASVPPESTSMTRSRRAETRFSSASTSRS